MNRVSSIPRIKNSTTGSVAAGSVNKKGEESMNSSSPVDLGPKNKIPKTFWPT